MSEHFLGEYSNKKELFLKRTSFIYILKKETLATFHLLREVLRIIGITGIGIITFLSTFEKVTTFYGVAFPLIFLFIAVK